MRRPPLPLGAWALAAAALAAWMALAVALLASTLSPEEQVLAAQLLAPRWALLVLAWAIALAGLAGLLRWLHARHVQAPARLLEATRVLLASGQDAPADTPAAGWADSLAQSLGPAGTPTVRALAQAVGELAAQRDALRHDVAEQVAQASGNLQQERNRLAALMAELTQSVVVCNLDGRILLYNNRARLQFRALSHAPELAGGAELVGIGRSIYAVFDRQLVAHALEGIRARLARGAAHPSTQFVTATPAGQLLRVHMAPVHAGPDAPPAQGGAADAVGRLSGFVLMLDNVTRSFEEEALRDRLLHGLTEASRSSLASMQAALDLLALPDLEPAMRERFLGVVRDEAQAMGRRVADVGQQAARGIKTRWPLQDMLGSDFLAAAARQIEQLCDRPVAVEAAPAGLWLRIDSFSLLQALSSLAGRLVEEFGVRHLQLRLHEAGERARLDLVWTGVAASTETLVDWEREPMRLQSQTVPLSVRDVVERHGGEMWFERERVRHQMFFRFLLPRASDAQLLEPAELLQGDSRPEYYDFDLFAQGETGGALDEQPLAALAYTVFDTETTGLSPAGGDQIIQLGAVRIVNGRLLRHESFEQLVDPGRMISPQSIPIHGITQEMVAGKPTIGQVLPAFHAFAQDTVLVAHNAAFDMKFLQLQEAATGVAFRQPVLDTLLLSAVVHPNQASHRLEDIAQRFGITVLGRHTALGDAMVTAEVLLRLIALLQAQGIHTLGQARQAAQATFYARLKY